MRVIFTWVTVLCALGVWGQSTEARLTKKAAVAVVSAVLLGTSLVAAQTEAPTTSKPSVAPAPPTPFPTPELPFEYQWWGETSFGYHYKDLYYWGYQHAIRRPGWSWGEPLAGYAPFCHNDKCYSIRSACSALGGELLHESVCSFPEDVKIAGPSCWEGDCRADGNAVCGSVGGITIGDDSVQWCLFKGERTVFGPACYNGECFQDELNTVCSNLGGKIWNRDYCILDDYYTVVGPVCWKGACWGSLENDCKAVGGTKIGRWCLVKGCDYTVIGPMCSDLASSDISGQCFRDDTVDVCNQLKGSLFAERFCLLPGTDWTLFGPTGYYETAENVKHEGFCDELADDIGPPFAFLKSYMIGQGFYCLVNKRLPPVGPFCQGNTCYIQNNTDFCESRGGEVATSNTCALPPGEFRRVEGPMMWNGQILESTSEYCDGLFCAVPEPSPGVNLRCPTSPLNVEDGPNGATPSPNGSNSSSAVSLWDAAIPTWSLGGMIGSWFLYWV